MNPGADKRKLRALDQIFQDKPWTRYSRTSPGPDIPGQALDQIFQDKPWTQNTAVPPRRDGVLYPPPVAGLFDNAFPNPAELDKTLYGSKPHPGLFELLTTSPCLHKYFGQRV